MNTAALAAINPMIGLAPRASSGGSIMGSYFPSLSRTNPLTAGGGTSMSERL